MPKQIVSFGFRHGTPTDPNGIVIDVREMGFKRNPFHDKALRNLRGTDIRVQEDVKKTPDFDNLYDHLKVVARNMPEDSTLWLGCTGGRHRSVTLAILLAKDFNCAVDHRDINKEYTK